MQIGRHEAVGVVPGPRWRHRDNDNNPPGPRGGPGTNWENPPGPRGGPGTSPDRRWRGDRDWRDRDFRDRNWRNNNGNWRNNNNWQDRWPGVRHHPRWRPDQFYYQNYWYPRWYNNGWDDSWRWYIGLRFYDDAYWWYYDDQWMYWDYSGLCWRAGNPRWSSYGWQDRYWPREWSDYRWRFCW